MFFMLNSCKNKGFSLTDLILGMMIISVAIVGILYAQNSYITRAGEVELGVRGVTLANAVMHTIRMHNYDEQSVSPWSSTLGTETGESSMSLFDDVDDYNGASWSPGSMGYPGFTITTSVIYVDVSSSWITSVTGPTEYKRIIVQVDHSGLDETIEMTSLIGSYK